MSWVLPVASLVATGIQAFGQRQQGQQQQAAYDYNAAVIEQEGSLKAHALEVEGALKVSELEASKELMEGAQRAAYAKANVMMTGSALDVMLDTATNFEFDKLVATYNAKTQADIARYDSQAQGTMQRYYGAVSANQANFQMGQTLVGGAVKAAGYIPTYQSNPVSNISQPSESSYQGTPGYA